MKISQSGPVSLVPLDEADLQTRLSYPSLAWYVVAHVVALTLGYSFASKPAVGFAIGSHFILGCAITLGAHRYFSHQTFVAPRWLQFWMALAYTLSFDRCGQGLISWAAAHKFHHAHSDRDLDPHSPAHGFWHSFCGHHLRRCRNFYDFEKYSRYCPELVNDPMLVWFDRPRNIWGLQAVFAAALFVMGGLLWGAGGFDWWMATSFLVWGIFVRYCITQTLHSLLDTLNHGTPPMHKLPDTYGTNTRSKNNFLLWPFHIGNEMWHNVHHAFPRAANNGGRWYRWDFDSLIMKVLESTRIINGCKWLTEDDLARRRRRTAETRPSPSDAPVAS
jgi:stearoyl-CoA desaturase (delta-9 desaturase)